MMNSNYPLVLDLHTAVSQASISVPRGDTARSLSITLCEDGKKFELPIGAYAVFTGEKADGTTLVNHCIIERGIIKYYFTPQTASAVGRIAAQIKVYSADEKLITSPRITIIVYETAVTDAMVSEDETTVLEGIIATEAKRVEAEALREEAEAARVEAENAREEAFANAKFDFEEERAEIVAEMEVAKTDIINSATREVSNKTSEAKSTIDNETSRAVASAKTEINTAAKSEVQTAKTEIQSEKTKAVGDVTKSKTDAVSEIQGLRAYVDEKEDLLWRNTNVTSAFRAQTVDLKTLTPNYNKYKAFRFVCVTGPHMYTGFDQANTVLPSVTLELGQYGLVSMNDAQEGNRPNRQIYLDNDAVVHFSSGFTVQTGDDDEYVIPTRIYGILNNEMSIDYVEGIKKDADTALKTANEAKEIALAAKPTDSSMAKKFANALVGKASGKAVKCEVSPIEHELGVKVEPPNLIPYPYQSGDGEINGLNFTCNGRTVSVSGVGTDISIIFNLGTRTIEAGRYTVGGFSLSTTGGRVQFRIRGSEKTVSCTIATSSESYDTVNFDVAENIENAELQVHFSTIDETVTGTMTPYLVKGDMSGVKLLRYGKNLINADMWLEAAYPSNLGDGRFEKQADGSYKSLSRIDSKNSKRDINLPAGVYTIKFGAKPGDKAENYRFRVIYEDGTQSDYVYTQYTDSEGYNYRTIVTDGKAIKQIYLDYGNTSTEVYFKDLQLEVGNVATEYEPYVEPTEHTPNADGTVEGVMSVYPTTTLIADTDGIVIDASYNKDANKVVASLEERIAALETAIVSQ